jgi:hypothetical protein
MAPRLLFTFTGPLVALDPVRERIRTAGFAAIRVVTPIVSPLTGGQRVGIDLIWNPVGSVQPRDVPTIRAGVDDSSNRMTMAVDETTYVDCLFPVLGDDLAISFFPWPFADVANWSVQIYGIPTVEQARTFHAGQILAYGTVGPLGAGGFAGVRIPMICNERVLITVAGSAATVWEGWVWGPLDVVSWADVIVTGIADPTGSVMTRTVRTRLPANPVTVMVRNLGAAGLSFDVFVIADP